MKTFSAFTAGVLCAILLAASGATAGTVGEAKMQPDGAYVTIEDAVVTASGAGFAYVSALDHSSGLRLAGESLPARGVVVNCEGEMSTTPGGERVLAVSTVIAAGSETLKPWLIKAASLGGADLAFDETTGAGQRGIAGGNGLNTVGQFVSIAGRLTAISADRRTIWIDDSSGAGPSGTTAELPEPMSLETGAFVKVTGVCGLRLEGEVYSAVMQVTRAEDVLPLYPNFEMAHVPAGIFAMGNTGAGMDDYEGMSREYPAHEVYVPSFWIGRTEVTRAQFRSFIQAGGYADASLWSPEGWAWRVQTGRVEPLFWSDEQDWGTPPAAFSQTDSHPVIGVSYYEAEAFARWAGARLPSEAEWEKAARWDGHSRVYPWGDTPSDAMCNDWFDTVVTGFQTAPVGSYAGSAAPSGCEDMAGNAWEWTSSWYASYPGAEAQFDRTGELRVLKGGSWYGMYGARAACRYFGAPESDANDVGFRIAR